MVSAASVRFAKMAALPSERPTMTESPREMVYREALERIAARGQHPMVNATHARVIARNALDEAAAAEPRQLWANPVVFEDRGRPGADMSAEVTATFEPDGTIRVTNVKCSEPNDKST